MTHFLPADAPVLDVDPFAEDFQREPEAFHERLREAEPVFYLERYQVWGMARYAEVHAVLRGHENFSSAAGVGLAFWKEEPWRPPSLLLEADATPSWRPAGRPSPPPSSACSPPPPAIQPEQPLTLSSHDR